MKKIEYLALIFLSLCLILVNKGSIFAAINDGSSLIDNYLEALEKQPGITDTDNDIVSSNIIKLMVYYDCDKNGYKNFLNVSDDNLGNLRSVYDNYSNNVYNINGEEIKRTIDYNSQYDTSPNFEIWATKGSEGINNSLYNSKYKDSNYQDDSWLGLLFSVYKLETSGYQDFTNLIQQEEYNELRERLNNSEVNDAEEKFKNLIYEYIGFIRLQAIIGNVTLKNGQEAAGIYETIKSYCSDNIKPDNNGNPQFLLDLPADGYMASWTETAYCSDFENMALDNLAAMAEVIAKMKDRIKSKMEKILSEGEVGEDFADASADLEDTEESATSNAANESWEKYNDYVFTFKYSGYKNNGVPSMDLGTLSNRLQGLEDSGTLSQFDDFNSIIEDDILGMVLKIGRYLIYAALLFFGVRCIWEGASGKAQFKAMLPYLLVALVFFYSGRGLVNVVQSVFDTYDYENYGADVFATIIYIVRILAFAGILFTGVKLMFASPEAKADVKSHLIPIIIGCLFVFSSSFIVDVIVTTLDEAGFERSNIAIERNIDVM